MKKSTQILISRRKIDPVFRMASYRYRLFLAPGIPVAHREVLIPSLPALQDAVENRGYRLGMELTPQKEAILSEGLCPTCGGPVCQVPQLHAWFCRERGHCFQAPITEIASEP